MTILRQLRATGFGPFRGNDGLTPRERARYARRFRETVGKVPRSTPERTAALRAWAEQVINESPRPRSRPPPPPED